MARRSEPAVNLCKDGRGSSPGHDAGRLDLLDPLEVWPRRGAHRDVRFDRRARRTTTGISAGTVEDRTVDLARVAPRYLPGPGHVFAFARAPAVFSSRRPRGCGGPFANAGLELRPHLEIMNRTERGPGPAPKFRRARVLMIPIAI